MTNHSVFRSAITDADGTVDSGYLSLFWIMAVVITAIPFMSVLTAVAMWLDAAHKFDVQGLGIGIGSVCTGFGVAVAAVGAFRAGDKPHVIQPSTTVTTAKTETVTTGAPIVTTDAEPLKVAITDMPPPDKPKGRAKK